MSPGRGGFLVAAIAGIDGIGMKAHGRYRFKSQPWLYAFGEAQAYRSWAGGVTGQALLGIGGTF